MVNIDWVTCRTKYADILDLFRAQGLLAIKQTRANACLFKARDTLLTVAWSEFLRHRFYIYAVSLSTRKRYLPV